MEAKQSTDSKAAADAVRPLLTDKLAMTAIEAITAKCVWNEITTGKAMKQISKIVREWRTS